MAVLPVCSAAIEETYAKSLERLKTKASKMGDNTYGTMKQAWTTILDSFTTEAQWHTSVAEQLRNTVSDPLLAFKDEQKKDHKTTQVEIEAAYKTYMSHLSDSHKVQYLLWYHAESNQLTG